MNNADDNRYFLERKMALDSVPDSGLMTFTAMPDERQRAMAAAEVEREIEEIKKAEGVHVPLEKLLTSLGAAGVAGAAGAVDNQGAVSPMDGNEGESQVTVDALEDVGIKKAGFTPIFAAPN